MWALNLSLQLHFQWFWHVDSRPGAFIYTHPKYNKQVIACFVCAVYRVKHLKAVFSSPQSSTQLYLMQHCSFDHALLVLYFAYSTSNCTITLHPFHIKNTLALYLSYITVYCIEQCRALLLACDYTKSAIHSLMIAYDQNTEWTAVLFTVQAKQMAVCTM